jgi:hypothetical protein
MPGTSLEQPDGGPYDPGMEARVSRLEEGMREVQSSIDRLEERTARLEVGIAEIKAMLEATLPNLATKAEVTDLRAEMVAGFADKPGKTYMWGVLAALLAAYACGLAGLALLK